MSLTSDLPDYTGFSLSCGRVNSSRVYMGVVWYVLVLRAATSENGASGPSYEAQVVAAVTVWGPHWSSADCWFQQSDTYSSQLEAKSSFERANWVRVGPPTLNTSQNKGRILWSFLEIASWGNASLYYLQIQPYSALWCTAIRENFHCDVVTYICWCLFWVLATRFRLEVKH